LHKKKDRLVMIKFDFTHLEGKVCVITGGAGVLGKSICEALVSAGIKTAILDLDLTAASALARELSDRSGTFCMGVQGNVLDKESLMGALEQINKHFGEVDFLINGAGGNSPAATTKVEQMPAHPESWEDTFFGLPIDGFNKVFALNFTGTLLPTQVFAQQMTKRGKGVVLNISSMNSFRPLTKIPAYSAAKASVNNFTQWLAVHLAKTGVRVNAIAPGFFLTHQNRFLLVDEKTGMPTPRGQKIMSTTPVGKYGQPQDLQGAVLFLLSDLSSFITGVVLPVDGGYSAYGGV
jgi:NAD(P)-dependent dehydrogenase (short-subunit alcohol dehydrogenase family)